MEITEIRITLRNEERLKGYVSVTFDDAFVVRGLKIIQGPDGFFIAMPSRKRADGSHQDVAHPVNSRMRQKLETEILSAYKTELETRVRS